MKYDKPVRLLIREMVDELAPNPGDVFTKSDAVAWFARKYPLIKSSTVTAHIIRFTTNAPSRIHLNPRDDEDLLFQIDRSRLRRYDPATDPPPITAARPRPVSDKEQAFEYPEEEDAAAGDGEFAYESDLQAFLAKNPAIIEPGLRLYEDEGITGVEFPVGGRFIDLLCVDRNGDLVVVELKVSRGYDRVVGQLARYMAWVQRNLAEEGQKVRGVIIAREITDDLRLACSLIPNVDLYEYRLSVELTPIEL